MLTGEDIIYITNDWFFRRAAAPSRPISDDLASIPKPIAGFFRLIENYIDIDLIDHVASSLPDVSFVLIGRVAQDVSQLRQDAT
jgi:hypothetical protein